MRDLCWQSDMMLLCAAGISAVTVVSVATMVLFSICEYRSYNSGTMTCMCAAAQGFGLGVGRFSVKVAHIIILVVLAILVPGSLCARAGGIVPCCKWTRSE